MRDVLLLISSLGLLNERLTATAAVEILTHEHPAENGHNFDVELTPLEFFEFIIEAARVYVSVCPNQEQIAVHEQAGVGNGTSNDTVVERANSGIEAEHEALTSAALSEKPSTAGGDKSSDGHEEKLTSKQSKKNVAAKDSSKKPDASKSKEKKEKDDKLDKTHSKDKLHNDGEHEKKKGKSPSEKKSKKNEKPSELDVQVSDALSLLEYCHESRRLVAKNPMAAQLWQQSWSWQPHSSAQC